jgi:hypothetical protein
MLLIDKAIQTVFNSARVVILFMLRAPTMILGVSRAIPEVIFCCALRLSFSVNFFSLGHLGKLMEWSAAFADSDVGL